MSGTSSWAGNKSRPSFTQGSYGYRPTQQQNTNQVQAYNNAMGDYQRLMASGYQPQAQNNMGGYQQQATPSAAINTQNQQYQQALSNYKALMAGGYSPQAQPQVAQVPQPKQMPTTQNYYDLPGINPNYKPQAAPVATSNPAKPVVTPENQKLASALKNNNTAMANQKLASVQKSMPFLFGG